MMITGRNIRAKVYIQRDLRAEFDGTLTLAGKSRATTGDPYNTKGRLGKEFRQVF